MVSPCTSYGSDATPGPVELEDDHSPMATLVGAAASAASRSRAAQPHGSAPRPRHLRRRSAGVGSAQGTTSREPAAARVAAPTGIPYALSTMGTTSIERLTAAFPEGRRWFQLYLWWDRAASRDFVALARDCGYETLV